MSTANQIQTREQLSRHPGYLVVTVRFEVPVSRLGQRPTLVGAIDLVWQWIKTMLPDYLAHNCYIERPQ